MRTSLLHMALALPLVCFCPVARAQAQNHAAATTGIANEADLPSYRLYPTPTVDYLIIELQNPSVLLVETYNAQGQVVLGGPILQGKNTLSVKDLTSGLYMVRLIMPGGSETTTRFLKQ